MGKCSACTTREQYWLGSEPICAFDHNGNFISANWMCATMEKLRYLHCKHEVYNEDQALFTYPIDFGDFLCLTFYKRRGRIENAFIVDGPSIRPLTLEEAERYLKEHGH